MYKLFIFFRNGPFTDVLAPPNSSYCNLYFLFQWLLPACTPFQGSLSVLILLYFPRQIIIFQKQFFPALESCSCQIYTSILPVFRTYGALSKVMLTFLSVENIHSCLLAGSISITNHQFVCLSKA